MATDAPYMGDPDALLALRETKDVAKRLQLERSLLRPTVFPLDADEAPSLWHRLLHWKRD